MRLFLTAFTALVLFASQVACATHTALTMPGPVEDENVSVGMHRTEVERYLGTGPASVYEDEDGLVARYEYSDGPHQASKVRVLAYVAGDVFTAFLSELVLWPIELYAKNRIERIASGEYDSQNVLQDWHVARGNGDPIGEEADEVAETEGTSRPGETQATWDTTVASDP